MQEHKNSDRKHHHIELAFQSQIENGQIDTRFYYEPLLAAHPKALSPISFLGKTMHAPIWISSMTGGTERAGKINRHLAEACAEFGLGMGLGSCRVLLDDDSHFDDFNLRPIIGNNYPFYANLGIAQIEQLIEQNALAKAEDMVGKLKADGLFIHVNPLQEWLQPEGDIIKAPPIDTIQAFIETTNIPVIVKEVGQGMGPESLRALLTLPLAAIEFAAHGGTNFSKIELLRSAETRQALYGQVAHLGHSPEQMVEMANTLVYELGDMVKCRQLILSGGVKDFLTGFYLINKVTLPSVYGQGSAFLKYAQNNYADLQQYISAQIEGLKLANAYLKVK